jgi:hypothetical protein
LRGGTRGFGKLFDDSARTVRFLYSDYGSKESFRLREGAREPIWSDPEEFIDYLDTAEEPSNRKRRPQWIRLKKVIEDFAPLSLRAVAGSSNSTGASTGRRFGT